MAPSGPRTVFDHIPKTGGTSVAAVIARAVGEETRLAESTYPHHVIIASAGERRFIGAHIWFYAGERLSAGWFYATLLRDPVDRFLSQYHFQRQHREQVLSGAINDFVTAASVRQELETYLEDASSDIRRSYTNAQACHFAARLCERPHELPDRQLLEASIASLEDYDLVGVHDDIQGFADSYCRALGQPEQALPRLNATRERKFEHELSRQVRDRLRLANAVDFALLDWARLHSGIAPARSPDRRAAAVNGANFGTREIEILAADFQGDEKSTHIAVSPQRISVRLTCRSRIVERDLTVGVAIRDSDGTTVAGANSKTLQIPIEIAKPQNFVLRISFNAAFPAGAYAVTFALHKGLTHLDRCYHWVDNAVQFSVEQGQDSEAGIELTIAMVKPDSNLQKFFGSFFQKRTSS